MADMTPQAPICQLCPLSGFSRRAAATIRAQTAEIERLRAREKYMRDTSAIATRMLDEYDAAAAEIERLRAALESPPKHRFWGAGEPDCPKEIKAGNGELHTLRCKVCGLDSPRDEICRAALGGAP